MNRIYHSEKTKSKKEMGSHGFPLWKRGIKGDLPVFIDVALMFVVLKD